LAVAIVLAGAGIADNRWWIGRLHMANSNADVVLELDRRRMQAMAARDVAQLEALLADDLVYTHSSARLDTKQSLIANMKSGATVYSSVEPSDVKAQDLGDVVVLTGAARIRVASQGKQLDFAVRFTDAYARRNGRWQMVVWQSTRLPD
jgi:ketosteroid isomerase-like protein